MNAALPLSAGSLLLILLLCAAWGGNFLASAIALREMPALQFTSLRLLLLGLLLLPWLRLPPVGQRRRVWLIALCNGAIHFGFAFWGLRLAGNLASPAILMQAYVPLTVLLAAWWLGERADRRQLGCIALSFAGVVVLGFDPLVLAAPLALALVLAAALTLAVGSVLLRGVRGVGALQLQALGAWAGLPLLLPLSLWLEGPPLATLAAASQQAWLGVIYSTLVASLLGHSIYFRLLQRHPVASITPYLLLAPVLAVVLGIGFFGDRPGPRLLIGGSMVLLGVLLLSRLPARRPLVEPATP